MIRSSYDRSLTGNKYLVAGILAAFFAQLIVVYTSVGTLFDVVPLSATELGVSVLAVIFFTVIGTATLNELDRVFGERANQRIKQ